MSYTIPELAKAGVGFVVALGTVAGALLAAPAVTAAFPAAVPVLAILAAIAVALGVFVVPNKVTEDQARKSGIEIGTRVIVAAGTEVVGSAVDDAIRAATKGLPAPVAVTVNGVADRVTDVAGDLVSGVIDQVLKGVPRG